MGLGIGSSDAGMLSDVGMVWNSPERQWSRQREGPSGDCARSIPRMKVALEGRESGGLWRGGGAKTSPEPRQPLTRLREQTLQWRWETGWVSWRAMATVEAGELRCEAQVLDEEEYCVLLRVGWWQDLKVLWSSGLNCVCIAMSGTQKGIPSNLDRRERRLTSGSPRSFLMPGKY